MRLVEKILGTKMQGNAGKAQTAALLKNKIFKLLDKYSQTPTDIASVLTAHDERIKRIFNMIQDICEIPDLCMLPKQMQADVVGDISNIIEKYLSINWKNKEVFIRDRDAYPIRISATDEEESKGTGCARARCPHKVHILVCA